MLLFVLFFFILGSDQLTKYMARYLLAGSPQIDLLGGVLRFSLVENHGGFLGIVSDFPPGLRFFFLNICVAILLAACLGYLLWSSRQHVQTWTPMACITGGGLSNLLDRLAGSGGVTDFIIIGTDSVHTGIFNLADVFILGGSFVLGYHFFKHPTPH
ncbi:MAG: signal peptidase II [Desulforhopalus sp.]|nr:signal peptidase II [Desulforhopalus sp.]